MRDKIEASFADLGDTVLKNIARPVRVYALKPGAAGQGRFRAGLSSDIATFRAQCDTIIDGLRKAGVPEG